jgi:hypothetical protein
MRIVIPSSCFLLILPGCVGLEQSRDLPVASAQTQEEINKLPVGRVVAVERRYLVQDIRNPLVGPVPSMLIGTDWFFHHKIRLLDGSLAERDEYMEYKIGDCVALRSQLVVPAFKGQCP